MGIKEETLKEIEKWTYPYLDITNKPSRVRDAYDYKKELFEAKLEGINEAFIEFERLIDEKKKRVCQVFGDFGEGDFVVEEPCPKDQPCDVCKEGELYLIDAEKLKSLIRGK